jgi:hypothetical protein
MPVGPFTAPVVLLSRFEQDTIHRINTEEEDSA